MAGHEFFEPADRKRPVADPTAAEPLAAEEPRHSCDPAFKHGVVVGFDGSTSSERALAYAIGMAHRSGSGLIIVHVANRLPTTVWAGCEPPVFVDVPDHRTEVLGLELACADYLAEVPWIRRDRRRLHPRHRRAHLRLGRGAARQAGAAARHRHSLTFTQERSPVATPLCTARIYSRVEVFVPL
jgi:nucleotide-binding universal stress UspA family protein